MNIKQKKSWLFGMFLYAFGTAGAQDLGINVGQQIPDIRVDKIINAPFRSVSLSKYKDQLLIIDFWSVNCVGCIEALPKLDSMRNQFAGKLYVLPVTWEPEATVSAFWKRNHHTRYLKLPTVVEDTILTKYFKHKTISHDIWIYKGKVVAITDPSYVDAHNIQKVLDGKPVNWPVKNDFYVFDRAKEPLFKIDTDQVNAHLPLTYSAISDYKEGVNATGFSGGGGIVRDSVHKTVRAFFLNQPVFNTYFMNLLAGKLVPDDLVKPRSKFEIGPNEVIWEVSDENKYTYISKAISGYEQDYERQHSICYESLKPDTGQTDQQVYKGINDDLDRLLGLKVRWEKRKEKVLLLVRTSNADRIKSQKQVVYTTADHDNGTNPHELVKGNIHQFTDISLASLVYRLNVEGNPYIFDETDYKNHVDLELDFTSWNNIAAIRKGLQKYGLDLREEQRMVDKFVFSEVNGGLMVDGAEIVAAKAKRAAQKSIANPLPADNATFLAANKSKAGVITLPSGLQYKVIRQGKGALPDLTDRVKVNYTGTLVNGKIFDSSLETGRPATFKVSEVIAGWTEALQRMPAGSKWMLYIPSQLAYGSHTNQGAIPPNSALVFEIELLSVVK